MNAKTLRWAAAAGTLLAAGPGFAFAQQEAVATPLHWWLMPVCAIVGLIAAYGFHRQMLTEDGGNDRMKEIAGHVRDGAYAYLGQQYRAVTIFFVVVAILLGIMAWFDIQHPLTPIAFLTGGILSGLAGFFGMNTATLASNRTAHACITSLGDGLRVAFRSGAVMGLVVVGLALLGISGWFYYLTTWHHVITGGEPLTLSTITSIMLSSALGASSMALFARVGGGIYTKAADVGADLVGKVEAGIPEDDPRNPATIADNVGDNVGDVAGMGADLFESYLGSILASAVLGVAAVASTGGDSATALAYVITPMLIAAAGAALSVLGVFFVRLNNPNAGESELLPMLHRAILYTNILTGIATIGIVYFGPVNNWIIGSVAIGLVIGGIIGWSTELFTAAEHKPTQGIAESAVSGTGPAIIAGIAEGMMSVWIPNVSIALGTVFAFWFAGGFEEGKLMYGLYGVAIAAVGMLSTLGITLATDAYGPIADNAGGNAEMAGLDPEVRQRTDALDSLGNTTAAIGKGFAIGSAALTALALLASYLEQVRVSVHREVAAGYVQPGDGEQPTVVSLGYGKYGLYFPPAETAAEELTPAVKAGYTISLIEASGESGFRQDVSMPNGETAAKHLVVNHIGHLLGAGAEKVVVTGTQAGAGKPTVLAETGIANLNDYMNFYKVNLLNPTVMAGVFLGVMLVFIFSALTLKAVGRAASSMVQEVRRQFKEKPGIMEGSDTPDYARCVSISTKEAQGEMILPTLLALIIPIVVGLVLNVSGVMGLLLGGLSAGFAVAVFMANSGGAWDNAKKFIEAGHHGGKGSDAHKAAVVGDTVGDPFKDTSGPSLNILIKLMNIVSIVFAGLVIKYAPYIGELLGIN